MLLSFSFMNLASSLVSYAHLALGWHIFWWTFSLLRRPCYDHLVGSSYSTDVDVRGVSSSHVSALLLSSQKSSSSSSSSPSSLEAEQCRCGWFFPKEVWLSATELLIVQIVYPTLFGCFVFPLWGMLSQLGQVVTEFDNLPPSGFSH